MLTQSLKSDHFYNFSNQTPKQFIESGSEQEFSPNYVHKLSASTDCSDNEQVFFGHTKDSELFERQSENSSNKDRQKQSNQKQEQQVAGKQINDSNYKTELCKTFQTTGQCKYTTKCRFAHGKEELTVKRIEKKLYKVNECEHFFKDGVCPYGQRCHFKHDTNSVQKILSRNYYQTKLEHYALFEEIQKQRSAALNEASEEPARRLKFFANLGKDNQKKLVLTRQSPSFNIIDAQAFKNYQTSPQFIAESKSCFSAGPIFGYSTQFLENINQMII